MFEQVVFAGGGNRCWWQAGFWEVVAPAIELRPRVIVGVSAGSATACLVHARDSRYALNYYRSALADVHRNAHWANLFRKNQAVFPHSQIYRTALKALLGGDAFRDLMWSAPEIRMMYSRIPRYLGPRSAVVVGLAAYNIEKHWRKPLHPSWGRALGFTSQMVRLQDCQTDDELVSLIMTSSCTPPFTPIEKRGDHVGLDGGLVDNIPIHGLDDIPAATLVMATRRYPKHAPVFMQQGRTYVQPSEAVAASSWDYTSVDRMQQTYDLGRRDGEAFVGSFSRVTRTN